MAAPASPGVSTFLPVFFFQLISTRHLPPDRPDPAGISYLPPVIGAETGLPPSGMKTMTPPSTASPLRLTVPLADERPQPAARAAPATTRRTAIRRGRRLMAEHLRRIVAGPAPEAPAPC